jgi:hypothetical protein
MGRKRYTSEQIITALREAEVGSATHSPLVLTSITESAGCASSQTPHRADAEAPHMGQRHNGPQEKAPGSPPPYPMETLRGDDDAVISIGAAGFEPATPLFRKTARRVNSGIAWYAGVKN